MLKKRERERERERERDREREGKRERERQRDGVFKLEQEITSSKVEYSMELERDIPSILYFELVPNLYSQYTYLNSRLILYS